MSDEHFDEVGGQADDHPSIDPALFWRADVRRVLAALDIGGLYRILGVDAGLTQRQIAARTGQSQSEVSDIVAGRRRVESHSVLVRIAERLGIPRELLGLSWWGSGGTYCGSDTVAQLPTREGEDVRRRTLIATTTTAAFGQVVSGLGELTELALPTGDPLPLRLSMAHVRTVVAVTERLRGVARQFGGQAELFVTAAKLYARWMVVPASEVVKVRLGAALAELYTEAGWACYDSGVDGMGCLTRALGLADEAGDAFEIANAAWHAGATLVRSGHPNDALKCFQLGQLVLAGIQLDLGRFDIAESLAACAVRTYGEGHRRGRTMAEIMVAEVHVRAGEPRGLVLARQAIEAVSTLRSVAVRRERLVPLITALEARPGNDAKEITRLANQIATTRI